jgi:hypothetical protein
MNMPTGLGPSGAMPYDRSGGQMDLGALASPPPGQAGQVGFPEPQGGPPMDTGGLSNVDLQQTAQSGQNPLDSMPGDQVMVDQLMAALEDPNTDPRIKQALQQQLMMAARGHLQG